MANLVYDLSIAPMLRALRNLDAIVTEAEAYVAADDGIDEATLMQARLYPNMRPFVFQIQVATDTARRAAARLLGKEAPSWPDDEKTLADVHARLITLGCDFAQGHYISRPGPAAAIAAFIAEHNPVDHV